MTTTPPPMPHEAIRQLKCVIPFRVGLESPDDAPVGNLRVILESAEKAAQEVEFCCAQWMERIAALEADISRCHQAMKDAGWHPGRTDDLLTDIIRAKGEAMRNLEADRKMLREALERVRYWAEGAEALYTGDHPVALARTALENTK